MFIDDLNHRLATENRLQFGRNLVGWHTSKSLTSEAVPVPVRPPGTPPPLVLDAGHANLGKFRYLRGRAWSAALWFWKTPQYENRGYASDIYFLVTDRTGDTGFRRNRLVGVIHGSCPADEASATELVAISTGRLRDSTSPGVYKDRVTAKLLL